MVQSEVVFLFIVLFSAEAAEKPAMVAYTLPVFPINSTAGSKCDKPITSTAEPDKCCKFPDLFADSLVEQCEKEFSLNSTTVNNEMLADSVSSIVESTGCTFHNTFLFQCVVECVFNKSGLNKQSKVMQEDLVKVLTSNAKNDATWTPLISKAVDKCYKDRKFPKILSFIDHAVMEDCFS